MDTQTRSSAGYRPAARTVAGAAAGLYVVATADRPSPAATERRRRRERTQTLLAAALCAAAVGSMLATARTAWRAHSEATRTVDVLTLDDGGYRYEFQVVTGDEALYDLSNDPRQLRNLVAALPDRAAAMREALTKRLHVGDLHQLMQRDEDTARILRSLGYL